MSVPLPDSVLPIKCLIVGASFEGLIAAYLLHRDGHQVTVIDKGSEDRRVSACPALRAVYPHGIGPDTYVWASRRSLSVGYEVPRT